MSDTPIATNLSQAFYIESKFFSEVAFNLVLMVNIFPKTVDFFLGEVIYLCFRNNSRLGQNLMARGGSNTINIL